MSDGELNEGTTWESVMLAAHHKLDNLIIFIDKNASINLEKLINKIKIKSKSEVFMPKSKKNFIAYYLYSLNYLTGFYSRKKYSFEIKSKNIILMFIHCAIV